jgi:hypothetical protein
MRHGESAMTRVPSHISEEFNLQEMSQEEMEAVYREMENTIEPID